MHVVTNACFFVTPPGFNLGRTKFTQQHETTITFNFYSLLDKQMTQCFTSICMSNISLAIVMHHYKEMDYRSMPLRILCTSTENAIKELISFTKEPVFLDGITALEMQNIYTAQYL